MGYLTEIDLLEGNQEKTKNARTILGPDKQSPSFGPFVEAHIGKAGLAAYQGLDSSLAYHETTKKAKGLEGKTFNDVQEGFQSFNYKPDGMTSASTILRAIRPVASVSYGLLPWAHEIAKSKVGQKLIPNDHKNTRRLTQQSNMSKSFGAANLLATATNELYDRINHRNTKLTSREAYLLSYLNRRHGVPLDIQHYKKSMSVLAKIRWLIRVVGMAALPALIAVFTRGKKLTTSPAFLAGNLASIADALAGMYETYRTQRLIKKIRAIAPYLEQELERTPPTQEEKAADKSEGFDFSGDFGSLMGDMQ